MKRSVATDRDWTCFDNARLYFRPEDATSIVSPIGETEEGATIYNLAGQRLSKKQKGINIVNRKKVLNK